MVVWRRFFAVILGVCAGGAAAAGSALAQSSAFDFQRFTEPASGPTTAIGSYAGGCLAGGTPVALDGVGYMVVRPGRRRNYGHPAMVEFLTDLGFRVEQNGLGTMLVADVSMPRGGPFLTGHASHQIGLDADIWLRLDLDRLPREEREDLESYVMIDRDAWEIDDSRWGEEQAQILRLAASDPRVARIFVHPVIKREMCRHSWPDRGFLRTLRPWFGHDSHFHVRLDCPAGDANCTPQDPPPAGDGCGEELLSWWPDPNAAPVAPAPPTPRRPPALPALCEAMLEELR